MPQLLFLLFFTADYIAPEATLTAGIKGYEQRAEAIRGKAIAEAESRAKTCVARAAAMRKAKVDAALVGTTDSVGRETNGSWTFGTSEEKADQVRLMTRWAEAWREMAADMKAKKIWPQIKIGLDRGIVPGATGTLPDDVPFKLDSHDADFAEFTASVELSEDNERPVLSIAVSYNPKPVKFRVKHSGMIAAVDAAVITKDDARPLSGTYALFRGVYQFIGVEKGKLLFHRVESLPIGPLDLHFNSKP